MIMGNNFLNDTETLSKHQYRFTKCLFSATTATGVQRINLIGENRQFLEGTLGGIEKAYAVPDTGAEGNVMDLW